MLVFVPWHASAKVIEEECHVAPLKLFDSDHAHTNTHLDSPIRGKHGLALSTSSECLTSYTIEVTAVLAFAEALSVPDTTGLSGRLYGSESLRRRASPSANTRPPRRVADWRQMLDTGNPDLWKVAQEERQWLGLRSETEFFHATWQEVGSFLARSSSALHVSVLSDGEVPAPSNAPRVAY